MVYPSWGTTSAVDTTNGSTISAVFDLDGNVIKSWENKGYDLCSVAYSHSGKYVLFASNKTDGQMPYWRPVILDIDRNSFANLIKDNPTVQEVYPYCWSPNDRMVACTGAGWGQMMKVEVPTGTMMDITPPFAMSGVNCAPVAWGTGKWDNQRPHR
jgi:tricorn protease-like protein